MRLNSKNARLKDFSVYKENNEYYVKAIYHDTDAYGNIDEVVMSNIPLPLTKNFHPNITGMMLSNDGKNPVWIDFGFGELQADNLVVEEKRIHTTKMKMTVEEIEKLLGFQVEIVSCMEGKDDKLREI